MEIKQEELEKVNGGTLCGEPGYYGKYSIFTTTGSHGGYDTSGPYATIEDATNSVVDLIKNTKFYEYINSTYATYCIMYRPLDGGALVKVSEQTRIDYINIDTAML